MDNTIKVIGSVVVGVGIGVLCTKSYYQKKYNDIANEEIESVKAYYADKDKGRDVALEYIKEAFEEEIKTPSREEEQPAEVVRYDTITKDTPAAEEIRTNMTIVDNMHRPYVIEYDEFSRDEDGYETNSLEFYTHDDSLVDGNEEITFIDDVVGDENLYNFKMNADIETLYIKNPEYGMKYEIEKIYAAFVEENDMY